MMNAIKLILLFVMLAVMAGCRYAYEGNDETLAPLPVTRFELLGFHYQAKPEKAELLWKSGELALFAGETAEDVAYNKAREPESLDPYRNSLFLRLRRANGTEEWRVLLTTGSNWREAAGRPPIAGERRKWYNTDKAWRQA